MTKEKVGAKLLLFKHCNANDLECFTKKKLKILQETLTNIIKIRE